MRKGIDRFYEFNGHRYAFNLINLQKVCAPSGEGVKQQEISQEYEMQENGEFSLSTKVEHETKTMGNIGSANDMMTYDIVKIMIVELLENNSSEDEFSMDMGTALALNTLISCGILEEIE